MLLLMLAMNHEKDFNGVFKLETRETCNFSELSNNVSL